MLLQVVVKIDVSALQVLLPLAVRFTCFISRVCVLTRRRYLDDLNVQVLDARDLPAATERVATKLRAVSGRGTRIMIGYALQQHAWGVLGV
jgi:hypothetical protein